MFLDIWLDSKRVPEFEKHLSDGRRPTALAISVLDVKQPANWNRNPAVVADNVEWLVEDGEEHDYRYLSGWDGISACDTGALLLSLWKIYGSNWPISER